MPKDLLNLPKSQREQLASQESSAQPKRAKLDKDQIPLPLGGNKANKFIRARFACYSCPLVIDPLLESRIRAIQKCGCPDCGGRNFAIYETWA